MDKTESTRAIVTSLEKNKGDDTPELSQLIPPTDYFYARNKENNVVCFTFMNFMD